MISVMITRTHDAVGVGFSFYPFILSSFFYLLSFCQLALELTERNSTKLCHMLVSESGLKVCVQNLGCPLPLKIWVQNNRFRRLRNITATYLPNETWYRQWGMALEKTNSFLHRLEISWTLVHKQLNVGPEFLPTILKCCIRLPCQASHTEVRERNSTKLCHMIRRKWR